MLDLVVGIATALMLSISDELLASKQPDQEANASAAERHEQATFQQKAA